MVVRMTENVLKDINALSLEIAIPLGEEDQIASLDTLLGPPVRGVGHFLRKKVFGDGNFLFIFFALALGTANTYSPTGRSPRV